mmetsp:Transcript_118008/g.341152  ORF Transcript_118008/g.341152 Transcript_118008/m.341152 type:complete len:246 (-) Transcript_118008:252-989(-)
MPAVRSRHRKNQLLLPVGSQLVHSQSKLAAQRLGALLDGRLRLQVPEVPPGEDAAAEGLDLDKAFEVFVLRFLLSPAQLELLLRGLLRARGPGQHRQLVLHLGHHLHLRIEVVVDGHPRVVEPAIVGAAVVEELLALLVEQLHPICEVSADVLLELRDLVLDLVKSTVPHYVALVLDDLLEEVVHRVPPNRLAGRHVVEVDAPLGIVLDSVLAPAGGERRVEGLLGDPQHVGLPDGVDVQSLDVL